MNDHELIWLLTDSCPSEKLCPKWQNCEVSEATGAPNCGCEPCTESERNSTG